MAYKFQLGSAILSGSTKFEEAIEVGGGLKFSGSVDSVAVASDHFMFLDGGATGAPKAESIDDFLTAIAGTGISVNSSQLTASAGGGSAADDLNLILHMSTFS